MPRPNVVLLTFHDLGRHLGCYGVPTVQSPCFDQVAADGARLADCFCTAPQCSPSRASLATGRAPHSNGVMGLTHAEFQFDLHPSEVTIGQQLRQAGYRTVLSGFQHITPPVESASERLGFDRSLGGGGCVKLGHQTADWLAAEGAGEPFYLEVNFSEPHRPFVRPGIEPDDTLGAWIPPWLPQIPEAAEEMAQLQGIIHAVDSAVGVILSALDAAGLRENTFLTLMADHGIAMPRAKGSLFDAGVEIAALHHWPAGGVVGGRIVDGLISNVDYVPTVLDAVGLEPRPDCQGVSYLGALQGKSSPPRERVFIEKTYHGVYDPMRGVRTERFKYIRNFQPGPALQIPGDCKDGPTYCADPMLFEKARTVPIELYDLEQDPLERENLTGQAEYQAVEAELEAVLWEHLRETGEPLLDGPVPCPFYLKHIAAGRRG